MTRRLRGLGLSDRVEEIVYCQGVTEHFRDIELVFACGDLPYSYIEFVVSTLNVPVFFVRGNHDKKKEDGPAGMQTGPEGAVDLHRRTVRWPIEPAPEPAASGEGDDEPRRSVLLVAGVEGSVRYKPGPFQYSQIEMWWQTLALVPGLLFNRLRYGRWLDVFVSHAPPRGTHDRHDLPHHGIDAFRWLVRTFRPAYHLHGHVHPHGPSSPVETRVGTTRVLNAFGARRFELELPRRGINPPFARRPAP